MEAPQRTKLRDGLRWHFQHGPIDLILEAFGHPDEVEAAYTQAWQCFEPILSTLVGELPVLRRQVAELSDKPVLLSRGVVASAVAQLI